MSINFSEQLYGPVFDAFAVDAVLKTNTGVDKDVRARDLTKGTDASFGAGGYSLKLQTVQPGAKLRMAELAEKNVTVGMLTDGMLTFLNSGITWRIKSHKMSQSPNGEADGLVLLLLTDEGLDR